MIERYFRYTKGRVMLLSILPTYGLAYLKSLLFELKALTDNTHFD